MKKLDGKPVRVRFESVTKQAYLTDFPLHILASSKRRFQARIRASRAALMRSSLSGYGVLFDDILPGSFLSSIDQIPRGQVRHRNIFRKYSPDSLGFSEVRRDAGTVICRGGIRLGWAAGCLTNGLAQDAPATWFCPETGLARFCCAPAGGERRGAAWIVLRSVRFGGRFEV